MKQKKKSVLILFLVSIFLFSTQVAYAYPDMMVEKNNVVVCSGDYSNGTYEPYALNANKCTVTVSFDVYALSGENETPKFLGHYTRTLPPESGYVKFQSKKLPQGCYWAYPTNIRVSK
ncbi:MAG: hypothetical protein K2L97_06900 [Muribaculaceae bacterium]|nr:hypothetical protein [Muribaculaceae bacterium]